MTEFVNEYGPILFSNIALIIIAIVAYRWRVHKKRIESYRNGHTDGWMERGRSDQNSELGRSDYVSPLQIGVPDIPVPLGNLPPGRYELRSLGKEQGTANWFAIVRFNSDPVSRVLYLTERMQRTGMTVKSDGSVEHRLDPLPRPYHSPRAAASQETELALPPKVTAHKVAMKSMPEFDPEEDELMPLPQLPDRDRLPNQVRR